MHLIYIIDRLEKRQVAQNHKITGKKACRIQCNYQHHCSGFLNSDTKKKHFTF
jgi:hypothetical protein